MIAQLRKIFARSMHNPMYAWYFMQNVDLLRDHFPSLYRKIQERKALDIGGATKFSQLHVVLRTTDFVMNLNASRQLEDIGIKTRNDVIRMGGCSLFPAAARFAEDYGKSSIRITLVVDRLSDVGLRQYREAANAAVMDFDIVDAKGHGNGPTFQTQIDIALQDADDTLALVLEDDYLLDEQTFTTCFRVMQGHSNVIGMNPHFHPDRVRFSDIGKLVVIDGKLYCRVPSTCCTFFMPVREMRRFEKKLRLYDGFEKGSVGCAWEKGICLAPLGWTLAEHLHRSDLSPVCKLLTDFKVNNFKSNRR